MTATYKCPKCNMAVNASCANSVMNHLVNDRLDSEWNTSSNI